MSKYHILLGACLLLAATTVTALVKLNRLQAANLSLKSQIAEQEQARARARQAIPPPAPARQAEPVRPPPAVAAPGNDAKLAALEAEVETLRREAAERDAQTASVGQPAATNRTGGRDGGWGRGRRLRDEELAELKKTDPVRFEEIEKQRTEFRERIKSAANDQVSFLESVDTSRWTADQQEIHAKLLANIAAFTDAMTAGAPPPEGGETSRREMFDRMREAGGLMEAEKNMLLYDTAQQMGFDDKGSQEFVEYIQAIDRATSGRGFFSGGRGPRQANSE